jgi:hypothetical protein
VKILVPLLKILAVSAPLTWLWVVGGREAYGKIFTHLSIPIFGILGLTSLNPDGARDRFINYLPFLILMLITPRLSVLRRVVGTVVGFVAIFFAHVAFVYVASVSFLKNNAMTAEGFTTFFPAMLLSDSLPLILWAIICHQFVRETTARIIESTSAGSRPASRH